MSLTPLRRLFTQSALRQIAGLWLVFAVISTLAWVSTFWLVTLEMDRLTASRLNAQAIAISDALRAGDPVPDPAFGQIQTIFSDSQTKEAFAFFMEEDLDEEDGLHRLQRVEPRLPDYTFLLRTVGDSRILVAENTERLEEVRDLLAGGLQWALAGSLVASLGFGLLIARRAQRRLDHITAGLAAVAQGQLATRIDLPGAKDDLSLLADRINATTERLQQNMGQMRVQSSNLAHDLRTPLARLRSQLEDCYTDLEVRAQPVTPERLEAALDQVDQIVATFDALLRIARIESGARKAGFSAVELGDLAEQVAEVFGPVVEDAGQSLVVQRVAPALIQADHELLLQLVANLIQNAMRYGADEQKITLRVDGLTLSVTDQGRGIPPSERKRVLEPLYQLEQTRQGEGAGLGLSMVRAICELHDAELRLCDGAGGVGLRVEVHFG